MNGTRTAVILAGILLIVGAGALGTWLGRRVEQAASPSPSPFVEIIEETVSPAPEASPAASPEPTATPVPPPPPPPLSPTPTPTPEPAPTLTLGSVPATVPRDTPLVVQWRIDGPPGMRGVSTQLVVAFAGSASVKSSTAASFALPAQFEATVHPRSPGELTITAEATVNGRSLTAEQRIRVE